MSDTDNTGINCISTPVLRVKRDGDLYVLADGTKTAFYQKGLEYATEEFISIRSYTMEGVVDTEGTLRSLSLGQMVMALCLERATEMEAQVVSLMDQLSLNTTKINAYSLLMNKFSAKNDGVQYVYNSWKNESVVVDEKTTESTLYDTTSSRGTAYGLQMSDEEYAQMEAYTKTLYGSSSGMSTPYGWMSEYAKITVPAPNASSSTQNVWSPTQVTTIVTNLTTELDSLNSISQEFLIEVQNITAKRDNAYDMLSAILKSLSTTLTSNASNLR